MSKDKVKPIKPSSKEIEYIQVNCAHNLNFDNYEELYMFLGGNVSRILDYIKNQEEKGENEVRKRMRKLAGLD